MELSVLEGKRVELVSTDNQIFRGPVGDYIDPEEDEDGKEMIIVDDEIRKKPIGFYSEDIRKITVI